MKFTFENLSDADLSLAYRGYLKLEETGGVSQEDFGGIMRNAIDHLGLPSAISELHRTLAARWYESQKTVDDMLEVGTKLWYVDEDDGTIEPAIVTSVEYKDGKLDGFGAEFPESDDFDVFYGSALGHSFFRTELLAKQFLLNGKSSS